MSRDITPISFKTVPGRNKTQKWTKAPAVDYGGDEWGGYDDYGDYDDDSQAAMPHVPPSQAPRDPHSSSGPGRKNSFDEGDETRTFSSGAPQPANTFPPQNEDTRQHTPGRNATRDFTNPEQVPAPLSMHSSPVSAPAPQGERWPGRKESMSSKDVQSIQSKTPEKPLPFIRPSDIYRRIPEEIRRQSEDGSRPSMDSIGSGSRERTGHGLEPVAESRESKVFVDEEDDRSTARSGRESSPRLPDVTRFSGFGTEFLTGSMGASPASPHSAEAILARVVQAPIVNTDGTVGPHSLQNTAATTRAPTGQDPAAETLPERTYDKSVDSIGGGQPAGLQHQPSAGFRSAVHTAFDRNDNLISRDNSQGSADVHRSDTSSTAGISPIISRGAQFPSIAEETSPSLRGQGLDMHTTREPSPSRTGAAGFEPGYRRSLDPPSTGTSPARTPGVESVATRRLSTPMSAVPMDAETPDVIDQGAEIPTANLEPAETPASEVGELGLSNTAPTLVTGRARSGTDYSMREADIAQTINSSSPEQGHEMGGLIDAEKYSQKLFLQTHTEKQPPSPILPGGGFREGASGSRAGSPAKSRVREIADRYHGLHEAARRNSGVSVNSSSKALSTKSSWSNFDEGEKKLARQGTGHSESEMFPGGDNADLPLERPRLGREESFRPELPGGWISSAPTPVPGDEPGAKRISPLSPEQTNTILSDEEELTPTTKKTRLQEGPSHEPSARTTLDSNPTSVLEQVKNAGSELGAALMASVGASHQTRDFASAEPAVPLEESEVARHVRGVQPPTLFRHETDSDAATSAASTMPPSPFAKDTPKLGETLSDGYFSTVAPLRVKSREQSPVAERNAASERAMALPRPGVTTSLSMEPGAEDLESDRLRKEIVRSLDPIPPVEAAQLIQDALDAPDNQRRVVHGESARPPAESKQPALLQTRFSWENSTPLSVEPAASPEIKPEMSYERPRSKALHVVNPNEVESPAAETPVSKALPEETLKPNTFGTPVTEPQEQTWLPETDVQPSNPGQSSKEISSSPINEREGDRDVKRQSYYASDSSQAPVTTTPAAVSGQNGPSASPISPSKSSAKQIPPFRNILALKTGDERIRSYNETRTTFANMNTGLSDWMGGMLALHPELNPDATTTGGAWKAPSIQTSGTGIAGTFRKGHKASPSLAKFTDKFGASDPQNQSTSIGSMGGDAAPSSSSAGINTIRPTTSHTTGPSSSTTGLPVFDADKMQQKGKAFMAKTGVLGGKAQAGAKGLFAKGRSRFASGGSVRSPSGSEKVSSSASASRGFFAGSSRRAVSSPLVTTETTTSARSLPSSGAMGSVVGDVVQSVHGKLPATDMPAIPSVASQSRSSDMLTADVSTMPAERSNGTPIVVGPVTIPAGDSRQSASADLPARGGPAAVARPSQDPPPAATGKEMMDAEEHDLVVLSASSQDTPAALPKEKHTMGVEKGDESVSLPPADVVASEMERRGVNDESLAVVTNAPPAPVAETTSLPLDLTSEPEVDEHMPATGNVESSPLVSKEGTGSDELQQASVQAASITEKNPLVFKLIEQDAPLARISTSPELLASSTMETSPITRPATAYAIPDSTETLSTNTPISAIRPGFSRHNSSKFNSPFRGNSPFRRDATQTPGSETGRSRPLSMAWTDWLRDKARSVSHGGSRRGGGDSRPASVMLEKDEKDDVSASASTAIGTTGLSLGDLSDPAVFPASTSTAPRTTGLSLGDLSDLAVFPFATTANAPGPIPGWTENWNSPDAIIPPHTTETRELMLQRLGILPSPAPTANPFFGNVGRRRRSSAARVGSAGGNGLGVDLEAVPSSPESAEERGSPVRPSTAILGLRKVSEAEEVVMRPRQKEKVSDLEMLPSEQKRASLGQGLPRPDSMILLQSQVDLLAGSEQECAEDGGKHRDGVQKNHIEDDVVPGAVESSFAVRNSRPATGTSSSHVASDAWNDARSEISAEEGAADEVPGPSTKGGTSRHSSVSSLGVPDTAAAVSRQVKVSAPQAAAVDSIPADAAPEQKLQRPGMTDRALSYMPLARDEAGLPVPETISTGSVQQINPNTSAQQVGTSAPGQQTEPLQRTPTTASLRQINTLSSDQSLVPVDLSAMSGPPPGTPPFQQHPVLRDILIDPTGGESVVGHTGDVRPSGADVSGGASHASAASATTAIPDTSNAIADAEDRSAKRQSGFFDKSHTWGSAPFANAPPPNRITDNHGLEDLQNSDDEAVVPDIQSRPRVQQPADHQGRRRSGFWDVLTSRRASSATMLDIDEGVAATSSKAEAKASDDNAKRKLQKPQRASSSAVHLEPKKKKRFSALGSLFGRSGTTRDASTKANRLTKMVPSSSENIRRTASPRGNHLANSSTVSGNVGSYEEFEAKRNRDLPAQQHTVTNIRPAAANTAQQAKARPVDTAYGQPPPEGWYGPSTVQQQSYFSPADPAQHEYRRLHSQGRTSAKQIPAAFRPVEASFDGPVMAVGPPPDLHTGPVQKTTPVPSGGQARNFSFHRQSSYETSNGSEFTGFSGQQLGGRDQHHPISQTPFGPDVSEALSRAGPPTPAQRVTSSGTETARSPAIDYPDQQTPWTINLPTNQGSLPASRRPSSDMGPNGTQYAGPTHGQPNYQQQHPQHYGPQQGPPPWTVRSGREYLPRSHPDDSSAYVSPYTPETNQNYRQQYSQPTQTHHQYSYPPPQQQQQQQSNYYQQPPRQRNRYYAPAQQAPTSQQYDPRRNHRRRSSGYSGRRDDMTANEEELMMMRGVSYPGQEWQPPGLGRSGWD